MARRVSTRGIKTHRQYTYEEAARVLGVSAQTVRSWRKLGLVVIDDQKPHLIVGACIKEFLTSRAAKHNLKLQANEFKCLRCNAARNAWGGLADYIPHTPVRGRLEALCDVCEGKCCKFASKSQLPLLASCLTIAIRNGAQAYRNHSTRT